MQQRAAAALCKRTIVGGRAGLLCAVPIIQRPLMHPVIGPPRAMAASAKTRCRGGDRGLAKKKKNAQSTYNISWVRQAVTSTTIMAMTQDS